MIQKIKNWFGDLKQGFLNLKRWFPIIWKDRDWDDYYIWVILEKKLRNQAKYIAEKGRHLDASIDSQRIMTCVRLIEKVRDEYYHTERSDYYKNKYYWNDIPDRPGSKQLGIQEVWENYDAYFKKYPRVYKQIVNDLGKDQKKSTIAMRMSWENHHRARKVLFKLLERHIESWWD